MSCFSPSEENRIRQIIDEQLCHFYKYGLKALEPPTVQPPQTTTTPKTDAFKDETIKNTIAQLDGSVKPIHYVDKDLFGRINDDLKTHGYTWISASKESRWVKT